MQLQADMEKEFVTLMSEMFLSSHKQWVSMAPWRQWETRLSLTLWQSYWYPIARDHLLILSDPEMGKCLDLGLEHLGVIIWGLPFVLKLRLQEAVTWISSLKQNWNQTQWESGAWGDDSSFRSGSYLSRGPEFCSQHHFVRLFVALASVDPTLSRHNIHTSIIDK